MRFDSASLTIVLMIILAVTVILLINVGHGGDPGTDEDPPFSNIKNAVPAKIEHRDDLIAPNKFFMLISAPIPQVDDKYAQTDSYAIVVLRGISVARAMHKKEQRNRPHDWVARERKRFDDAMSYIWNLTDPKHTFRLSNIEILENDTSLLADIEYYLGGQWHNLAASMLNDKHAYLSTENEWEFGDTDIGFVNPNIPK